MRIVSINSSLSGSTGKIMIGISEVAREAGHEVFLFTPYQRGRKKTVLGHEYFGSFFSRAISKLCSLLFGLDGIFPFFATKNLIKRIRKIKPDIIQLHNIHGWYLSFPVFFDFLRKENIPVVWTFHDCWPFTGHCTYFSMIGCDKWKTACRKCPQLKKYPKSIVDSSNYLFKKKKNIFSNTNNMIVVTPSEWLKSLVSCSFFSKHPIYVINNGVNLTIFNRKEHFKSFGLESNVILGVSFGWEERKGLDVFVRLANDKEMEPFKIVLVGTNEEIERSLPKNIISIRKTQNQDELADLYSKALVLLNPTREDNYPTINMESICCGTPVITFDTGGSKESVLEGCGIVVDQNDYDGLKEAIMKIKRNAAFYNKMCLKKRYAFDEKTKFREYVQLFENNYR